MAKINVTVRIEQELMDDILLSAGVDKSEYGAMTKAIVSALEFVSHDMGNCSTVKRRPIRAEDGSVDWLATYGRVKGPLDKADREAWRQAISSVPEPVEVKPTGLFNKAVVPSASTEKSKPERVDVYAEPERDMFDPVGYDD